MRNDGRAKGQAGSPEESDITLAARLKSLPLVFAVLIAVVVLGLDISLPLGVAGGVPYVALVLVGWWCVRSQTIFFLAATSTVLTFVGYYYSPDGGIPWVVYTNRAYAIFAIWVTAFILWLAHCSRHLVLQSNEKLSREKLKAEKANQSKSRFLSSMSHELRTPLNAIIGFSQLMQHSPKEPLTPKQKEYTDDIIASGQWLLELINGVLDLAKIEAGRFDLLTEDVYVDDVINESLAQVKPIAEAHAISVENLSHNKPQILLHCDPMRLKQVLLNLLSNAVKYNKPGGSVTLDREETQDGYLRISVVDTGLGISPELHQDIFKPFERLGIEAIKTIEGTGIGLTMSKQLIEMMEGRIGFESEPHLGSTFWIEMPTVFGPLELLWNDKLRIGVEQIDNDHITLIGLLNKLCESDLEDDEVDAILHELIDYSIYHFRREEVIMEVCGYPDLERHHATHEKFATKAKKFANAWQEKNEPKIKDELLEFLRTWLVNHIMHNDAKIVPYARSKKTEIEQALKTIEQ